jgi:hypothetical protein
VRLNTFFLQLETVLAKAREAIPAKELTDRTGDYFVATLLVKTE